MPCRTRRQEKTEQPATSTLAPSALRCGLENDAAQAWKKRPGKRIFSPTHHKMPYSQSCGMAAREVRFLAGELAGLPRLQALAFHIACYRQRRRVRFADGAHLAGVRRAWEGLNSGETLTLYDQGALSTRTNHRQTQAQAQAQAQTQRHDTQANVLESRTPLGFVARRSGRKQPHSLRPLPRRHATLATLPSADALSWIADSRRSAYRAPLMAVAAFDPLAPLRFLDPFLPLPDAACRCSRPHNTVQLVQTRGTSVTRSLGRKQHATAFEGARGGAPAACPSGKHADGARFAPATAATVPSARKHTH